MEGLPIRREVIYPKELLDNLERVINSNNQIFDDYYKNKTQFDNLKNALNPILEINRKVFNFPDIDINEIPSGTTVKEVKLNDKGEKLVSEAIELQDKLMKKMHG